MKTKVLRYIRAVKDYLFFYEWKLQNRPGLRATLLTTAILLPNLLNWMAPRDWGNFSYLSPIFAVGIFVTGLAARSLNAYGPRKNEFRDNAIIQKLSSEVNPSEVEVEAGFISVPPRNGAVGAIVYSRNFNANFICNPAWDPILQKYKKSERYKNIISEIKKNANAFRADGFRKLLASLFSSNKALINEEKVGLMTDLLPDISEIEIYRTDYFSDMCLITNGKKDIYALHPHEVKISDDAFNGRMPYSKVNNSGIRLRELSNTTPPLSLHIGVEVLALSNDFLFRIPIQAKGVQHSQGLRAPYASGSLDWDDTANAETLKALVCTGAKRELEEEWGGKGRIPKIRDIEVIGYFRHGDRGGKPQFVCFAKLDADDGDIWPDVTENVRGDDPKRTSTLDTLKNEIERLTSTPFNNQDSTPLFGALICLLNACEDRPETIKKVISA
ncbi:MAG: hypothetical protein AAGC95_11275 [Pseudomonadota bacterium]